MPANKLSEFLDSRGVKYVTIRHSPASTFRLNGTVRRRCRET